MAAHLSRQGHSADVITEAVSQWLHFIRPGYYVALALEEDGLDPSKFGFSTGSSCFTDRCDEPFHVRESSRHLGGCGGMDQLISVPAS